MYTAKVFTILLVQFVLPMWLLYIAVKWVINHLF